MSVLLKENPVNSSFDLVHKRLAVLGSKIEATETLLDVLTNRINIRNARPLLEGEVEFQIADIKKCLVLIDRLEVLHAEIKFLGELVASLLQIR